jgi:hypothetical protein
LALIAVPFTVANVPEAEVAVRTLKVLPVVGMKTA